MGIIVRVSLKFIFAACLRKYLTQECIPVGCVPAARCPYSGGVCLVRGGTWSAGYLVLGCTWSRGVYLVWGGTWSWGGTWFRGRGVSARYTPPRTRPGTPPSRDQTRYPLPPPPPLTESQTGVNIYLGPTSLRPVNIEQNCLLSYTCLR